MYLKVLQEQQTQVHNSTVWVPNLRKFWGGVLVRPGGVGLFEEFDYKGFIGLSRGWIEMTWRGSERERRNVALGGRIGIGGSGRLYGKLAQKRRLAADATVRVAYMWGCNDSRGCENLWR